MRKLLNYILACLFYSHFVFNSINDVLVVLPIEVVLWFASLECHQSDEPQHTTKPVVDYPLSQCKHM